MLTFDIDFEKYVCVFVWTEFNVCICVIVWIKGEKKHQLLFWEKRANETSSNEKKHQPTSQRLT